jgi:hypothetical protein
MSTLSAVLIRVGIVSGGPSLSLAYQYALGGSTESTCREGANSRVCAT